MPARDVTPEACRRRKTLSAEIVRQLTAPRLVAVLHGTRANGSAERPYADSFPTWPTAFLTIARFGAATGYYCDRIWHNVSQQLQCPKSLRRLSDTVDKEVSIGMGAAEWGTQSGALARRSPFLSILRA